MAGGDAPPPGPIRPTLVNLLDLGLRSGDAVRFRVRPNERWRNGRVTHLEPDGSIGIVDSKLASRSIPPQQVEVKATGPRGGAGWEPLPDRAERPEQLPLL